MVSYMFVPVSPSGTGNTLSESTYALFISNTFAPDTIIFLNSVPPMVFGMAILNSFSLTGYARHSRTPITLTLTESTIMPVNLSTRYLTLSLSDCATALIDTPNLMMTYTSI